MDLYTFIEKNKIVSISRGVYGQDLLDAVQAVSNGGIKLLEVTFDQKSKTALSDTGNSIYKVKENFGDKIRVGAGTVVTKEQVKVAKDSGADFILAPNTDFEIIAFAKSQGLFVIPGAFTPSEIVDAYNAGADIIKLFPASNLGIEYLKAIRSPINHIPLMAVGGVSLENVADFLNNGCMSVGIGSSIINLKAIKNHNFDQIQNTSRAFIEAVK